jgi:hypothetical protein
MTTDSIKLEWVQPDERTKDREDAMWYTISGTGHDLILYVTEDDRTIGIYADGAMDIRVYDKPNGSNIVGRIRYEQDTAEHGLTNDATVFDAHETGRIEWVNNPWFDLYTEDGDHIDVVCHTLSDAIEQAKQIVGNKYHATWEVLL